MMIVRNKKTGQYVANLKIVDDKVVLDWTNDPCEADLIPEPDSIERVEGFKSFQKAMNLELELIDEKTCRKIH